MGYYTNFAIRAYVNGGAGYTAPNSEQDAIINEKFAEITGMPGYYGDGYDDIKWYDYTDELEAITRDLPWVMIYVQGDGEEPGDFWHAIYAQGKELVVEKPERKFEELISTYIDANQYEPIVLEDWEREVEEISFEDAIHELERARGNRVSVVIKDANSRES